MGRKVNWFCSVNKALRSECKDTKDQRSSKTKKKWFAKKKSSHPISVASTTTTNNTTTTTTTIDTATTTTTTTSTTIAPSPPVVITPPVEVVKPLPILPPENVKAKEEEDEQKKHAQSIAIATEKAAEAAAAAAQAAAEVVRLTSAAQFPAKLKEEAAALRIQTSFRRYLARRALGALRGLASLKIAMQGESMKRRTTNTFKSIQSLVRVQSQVRDRRLRVSSDNQVPKGLILEKQVKELRKVESLQLQHNETGWDGSPKSKEQREARLQSQHEAAMRRDRALAYSLNHQKTRRNSPTARSAKANTFMDSKSHHSGWSWLERWLAARPWETASNVLDHHDNAFLRTSTGSEIAKAIMQHVSEKQTSATSSPRSLHSTPKAAQRRRTSTGRLSISAPSKARVSSRKAKVSTKATTSPRRSMCCPDGDEDARSSVGGDDNDNDNNNNDGDDSLVTSPAGQAVPSYMAPTESAKAKSRLGSSLNTDVKHETMDRLSVCSAKKRNSVSSITDAISIAEQQSLINAM